METFFWGSQGQREWQHKESIFALDWRNKKNVLCPGNYDLCGAGARALPGSNGNKITHMDQSRVRRAVCRDEQWSSHDSLGAAILETATLPRTLFCPQAQSPSPSHPHLPTKDFSWEESGGFEKQIKSLQPDTDVENKCMDAKVGRGGGMNWERGIDIYTLLILCIK